LLLCSCGRAEGFNPIWGEQVIAGVLDIPTDECGERYRKMARGENASSGKPQIKDSGNFYNLFA